MEFFMHFSNFSAIHLVSQRGYTEIANLLLKFEGIDYLSNTILKSFLRLLCSIEDFFHEISN